LERGRHLRSTFHRTKNAPDPYHNHQLIPRSPREGDLFLRILNDAVQSATNIRARLSDIAGRDRQDLLAPALPVSVIFAVIVAGALGTYGVTQAVANLLTTTTTAPPTRRATVTLIDSSSVAETVAGTLSLVYESGELKITGTVTGLSAGAHGFHVHEKGLTSNNCADAGGHFNPENKNHGRPTDSDRHVGDFGNIVADSSKSASVSKVDRLATLGDGGIRDIARLAIVIHADADSWSQPTGAAGARAACGIITLS